MTKSPMPDIKGNSSIGRGKSRLDRGGNNWIELIMITIAPMKNSTCFIILHRETKWVKVDRYRVIDGEATNRNEVLDNFIGDENIFELKRPRRERKLTVPDVSSSRHITITNLYETRITRS